MKSDHVYALLEEMNGKFDFIVEAVQEMRLNMVTKREFYERLDKYDRDDANFKQTISDISIMVANHEKRITLLEKFRP